MSESAETSSRRRTPTEKLSELRAKLLGLQNGKLNGDSKREPNGRAAVFAESLFNRAPGDFLQRTTLQSMTEINSQASDFFDSFQKSKKPFLVQASNLPASSERGQVTVFLVAITDRPFVVDTVLEFLAQNKLHNSVVLHPILTGDNGQRVSLNYIETDRVADENILKELTQKLEVVLQDLMLVTDDFKSIISQIEGLAEATYKNSMGVGSANEGKEIGDLLKWLADGGFVFLGSRVWHSNGDTGKNNTDRVVADVKKDLGLFRSTNPLYIEGLKDSELDANYLLSSDSALHFSKVFVESTIHRRVRMELVTIKVPGTDSARTQVISFLGMLTSKSISQETSSVPIVRTKLEKIIELEGLLPNSHDYKEVVSIIDSFPKSELFRYSIEALRKDLRLILGIQQRNEVRISLHSGPLKRFISLMVIMPRDRFAGGTRQKIQSYIERKLGVTEGSSEYRLAVTDDPLLRIHFFVPNRSYSEPNIDLAEVEASITQLARSWDDNLGVQLNVAYRDGTAQQLADIYSQALPERYKAATSVERAVQDIAMLKALNAENPLEVAIRKLSGASEVPLYDLTLYKQGDSLTLSAIIPYLENAGFVIADETLTQLSGAGVLAGIYNLHVRPKSGREIVERSVNDVILPGLKQIFLGRADNDPLNSLLLDPGLALRELAILRALQNYLWQIKAFASKDYISSALTENSGLARILVDAFRIKFDPQIFVNTPDDRLQEYEKNKALFSVELKAVKKLVHDRALRALFNVIDSAVRTNFYRNLTRVDIAIKIECKKITQMPNPRPLFEIFVNAPDFEAVHLRGGKVARGGIRWSERPQDYRTEVLGLMKTQMVKNSIIIPVGAKGGFVVRNLPDERKKIQQEVERCYTHFVRSLLEVSDNRIGGEVKRPENCVIYDAEDPYLVVAADKGTATFSDLANRVAVEDFSFWLGDAFASGGSYGYDHKKLGITARGAWECVVRHFREIGIDVESQLFTVVGIGDMSGDVFGNGLLRSENAKLIGAFNHRHIFLDPNPDPEASFKERTRLFNLPGSQWSDYNSALISPGGGVFDRSQKEIPLSPEIQTALGINSEVLSGEELIKAILKAPVDLLWNGGIGTYVKASTEDHIHVGDPINDDVRVDARDLRVKIIGEGGNLGFTQQGRIEYSKVGGHCNTDAVDNSGGVNTSDLEVNLKILLREPVSRGELTFDQRNTLLFSCADDVCESVISRNRAQSMVLSLEVHRSRKNLDSYRSLISTLEHSGQLSREGEFLPDDETIARRAQVKAGLTRPELAILISYVRIALVNAIIDSSLPEEPFLQRYLFSYFPKPIAERFPEDILKHPLRREIIATQVASALVERMGATFAYRAAEETGAKLTDIISAFLAADSIAGSRELTRDLRVMDKANSTRAHQKALLTLTTAIEGMTRWILEHRNNNLTWSEIVEAYSDNFQRLASETESFFAPVELSRINEAQKRLVVSGFPQELARDVVAVAYGMAYLDVALIANRQAVNVIDVARLYANLASELQISRLLEQAKEIEPADRWEALAVRNLSSGIRDSLGVICSAVINETGGSSSEAAKTYLTARHEVLERLRLSTREFHNRSITIPALLVISNQLDAMARVGT